MDKLLIALGVIGFAAGIWLGSVVFMLWKYERDERK